MKPSELQAAIEATLNETGSDLFVYSAGIEFGHVERFRKLVTKKTPRRSTARVFLTTNGGDADAAYRMAACLKRFYSSYSVYVFGMCKSAGTLAALGATEIIFGDFGELGPLDVQLTKRDELIGSSSGLDILQAIGVINNSAFQSFEECMIQVVARSGGNISAQMAADIATQMSTGLFSPITAQIDPERLGEVQRAINIANAYGDRLNGGNLKSDALERLVQGYPSHSFVIDQAEAEKLFRTISSAKGSEVLVAEGFSAIRQQTSQPVVVDLETIAIQIGAQGISDVTAAPKPAKPADAASGSSGGAVPVAPSADGNVAGDSQPAPQDGDTANRPAAKRQTSRRRGVAQ
jgi:hypothetical protein